ncbi:MAG: hypothetical protein ACM3H9_02170 [Rhodospirillaceae bacterium]
MRFQRTLEMTISRAEFFRFLRAAVPAAEDDGETVWWLERNLRRTIRLVPLSPRRLAGAALPRHRVEIVLDDCTEDEGEAFMARLHRAFLRGGG